MLEIMIAAAAGVLGAALGSWATLRAARTGERSALAVARISPEPREAEVEVVDASFIISDDLDPEEQRALAERDQRGHIGSGTVLDLKLLNRGGQTAYVTEVRLRTRRSLNGFQPALPEVLFPEVLFEAMSPDPEPRPFPPLHRLSASYYYRTHLKNEEEGVRVSQVLPPGEADRVFVSVDTPHRFFRVQVSVEYNAGRVAAARREFSFLQADHDWVNADSMIRLLESRLEECGGFAAWKGTRMSTAEAGRLCLDEYEAELRELASIYVETGRESDANSVAIRTSLARVPEIRQALGLVRRDPQP